MIYRGWGQTGVERCRSDPVRRANRVAVARNSCIRIFVAIVNLFALVHGVRQTLQATGQGPLVVLAPPQVETRIRSQ